MPYKTLTFTKALFKAVTGVRRRENKGNQWLEYHGKYEFKKFCPAKETSAS